MAMRAVAPLRVVTVRCEQGTKSLTDSSSKRADGVTTKVPPAAKGPFGAWRIANDSIPKQEQADQPQAWPSRGRTFARNSKVGEEKKRGNSPRRREALLTGAVCAIPMMTLNHGESAIAAAPKGMRAEAKLVPTKGSSASGTVSFREDFTKRGRKFLTVEVNVSGLKPNSTHGLNIHEVGNVECDDGECTGESYNPENRPHGGRLDTKKFGASASHYLGDGLLAWRHIGDLGNVVADDNGVVTVAFNEDVTKLEGENTVLGRSVVIHADADDLTSPTGDGNAGKIIAYGTIKQV